MQATTGQGRATVSSWNAPAGWGVVTLDAGGLEVWVHRSALAGTATSFHELPPGQRVWCAYETPGQAGYPARAVRVTLATTVPPAPAPGSARWS